MTAQQTNPLNAQFWVDKEYGQRANSNKTTQALTAIYGAIGISHLIERSISEMHAARYTEHEYAGLEPVLLENLLCAQKVLLELIGENLEAIAATKPHRTSCQMGMADTL